MQRTLRQPLAGVLRSALIATLATWAAASSQAALLLSADFGMAGGRSELYTGAEADATAANAAFAAAHTWNALLFANYAGVPVSSNPTFGALVDNSGATTGVSFSITGDVRGYDGVLNNALRQDYLFFNSTPPRGVSSSIDWQISGLKPDTQYTFYAYGAAANAVRLFDMLVDTNGDDSLSDETVMALGSTGINSDAAQDAYYASVVSDASGVIHGRSIGLDDPADGGFNEDDWAGFQLAELGPPSPNSVPLPGTAMLMGLGLCVLVGTQRRQPR